MALPVDGTLLPDARATTAPEADLDCGLSVWVGVAASMDASDEANDQPEPTPGLEPGTPSLRVKSQHVTRGLERAHKATKVLQFWG